jgi:hypothetical protein
VLLFIAIVLFLVFGGLGFLTHLLWFGLIVAGFFAIAHALTGGLHGQ